MLIKAQILALLLAGIVSGSGVGQAIILNKCSYPIYYASVGSYTPPLQVLPPNSIYSEQWRIRTLDNAATPNITLYGGISLKISPNQSIGTASDKMTAFEKSTIIQFEYTYLPTTAPGLWYDISNVNGYLDGTADAWDGKSPWPFQKEGLVLQATNKNSNCEMVVCPGGNPDGNSSCNQAYTHPNDNWATHGCDVSNSLMLTLCTS
ncbi:predicted protein [Sclerotinia sclerotiorum 1980 UF-70]|uniref:Uncharacterized protein n=2 Tax=Sclerotinia sclerotiorum (strain ATCC 18683 / 1980 / Ss-1) TaxID=665079 RepID=A7ERQ8_SCLS1|nr:predicted protein [Sclerotinia sclerotiorum 1980 UF-70]APA13391.1 hypothetical protein sscle_11g081610 [Sclerotinia sclerotiorum 1980 UF-70]EDN92150.1 predicted protein [Sclerotinia sclerotiorum 1980 UF-70]